MSIVKQRKSTKGSQFWLQEFVNNREASLSRSVQKSIGGSAPIEWLSPLKTESYAEYRDDDFLTKLGITPSELLLKIFWPQGGPQWDGLAITGKECLLIEAKAHVHESASSCAASSPASKKKIRAAFNAVISDLKVKPMIDWYNGLYQTANRVAHLHFLRIVNKVPARLVFINFTNDHTQTPTTEDEFKGARLLTEKLLGLSRHRLQRYIHHVYIDVKRLKA